jgi:ribosomal-protein-alanine N-acetyltransferase
MSQTILETERLVLSTWDERGAGEVYELHADPAVNHFLFSYGPEWTPELARARIVGWLDEYKAYGLGKHRLSLKESGEFIGRAGFSAQYGEGPEISYSLGHAHWGRGYAFEIASALSDWFFRTQPHDFFTGFAHCDNVASRRVLEKIGMSATHEKAIGEMPHQFYRKDRPVA